MILVQFSSRAICLSGTCSDATLAARMLKFLCREDMMRRCMGNALTTNTDNAMCPVFGALGVKVVCAPWAPIA